MNDVLLVPYEDSQAPLQDLSHLDLHTSLHMRHTRREFEFTAPICSPVETWSENFNLRSVHSQGGLVNVPFRADAGWIYRQLDELRLELDDTFCIVLAPYQIETGLALCPIHENTLIGLNLRGVVDINTKNAVRFTRASVTNPIIAYGVITNIQRDRLYSWGVDYCFMGLQEPAPLFIDVDLEGVGWGGTNPVVALRRGAEMVVATDVFAIAETCRQLGVGSLTDLRKYVKEA